MNAHFEAQTVLESLHWLAENQNQIDLPTALLIQAAEDPWSRVMEASKARTNPPGPAPAPATAPTPAPAPAKVLVVTLEPKQNAPQVKLEAKTISVGGASFENHLQPPRKMAGL